MRENLSEETGLQQLQEGRLKHRKNPLIGYLNINSLRNKITDLRLTMKTLSLDYLILGETKIDESFPTSQINVEGYEIRARRDRDKLGGDLIEFVRRGLICKRLRDYEPKYSECLCSEFNFTNKKWICFSIYRPPESSNLSTFFEELTTSLSKAILKYENLFIMGDSNVDMKSKSLGYDKLDEFCDLSLIDLFLTNTPLSFQKTHVSETGLREYHKLITTFFKTNFYRLRPKVLSYRNCKNFIESKFLNDLNKTIISFDNENPNQNYNVLSNRFLEVVNVHAPLKTKIVRGNDAPFVDKQLRKAIYTRTRLKNKIHKNRSKESKMAYKKQRNFCASLRRKCMKNYLKKLTEKGLRTNKSFWKFMKPLLTNKGFTGNNDITLIHQNKIISDEKQLTKLFNIYYINIVEKSSDTKIFDINFKNTSVQSVRDIANSYKNHPSIKKLNK